MTCKDCIHFSLCDYNTNNSVIIPKVNLFFDKGAEKCSFFKDQSKIIELPCKVGDTVYQIANFFGLKCVRPLKVLYFTIGTSNGLHIATNKAVIDIKHLGKTLFTGNNAKAEAEQALREGENK